VCAEAGFDAILRWVPYPESEKELRNRVKNKMIRPTTIPQTIEALIFEQAVAREALRLAYVQHKQFATTLAGVQQQRTIGDAFTQTGGQQTIVDNLALDLIVGSGGVLSHAPRMEQTAMMMIDAFEPEGVTALAKDSIFMMPHLGVLAEIHPQAAMDVFERDCLVMLATCIAPKGPPAPGKVLLSYTLERGGRTETGELRGHEMTRLDLGPEETAKVRLVPASGYDVGAGPGKPVEREIRGGSVGVIFDGRGRPLALPANTEDRRSLLKTWNDAIGLYPDE
ncbi:MAG: methylaspartate mutase, partial [Planctomyces sp.]|nr:methylaspartate mutase [Planctomyces sp.]